MKNNGFFSIYALIWVNIASVGAILIITSAVAVQNAKQKMNVYDAQIVSVYRTKKRLQQMNRCMMQQEFMKKQDTEESEVKKEEVNCIADTESYRFHDVQILAEYDIDSCLIHLNEKRLRLTYDISSMRITNLEYLSNQLP